MMWKFPTYDIAAPINWNELESNFDWFQDMKGVPQDPIWHAEGDVFIHTKMVVEALVSLPEFQALDEQEKHILFAAAMLHDVEKRSTTTTEIIANVERIVSPKHAKKGEFTTRKILYKDIATPFAIRELIAKLVRLHGLPLWAIEKSNPQKEVISASALSTKLFVSSNCDAVGQTFLSTRHEARIDRDVPELLIRRQECLSY